MRMRRLDHIVLCVADVSATCRFYERVLGLEAREERPGKWPLHLGDNKISFKTRAPHPHSPGAGRPAVAISAF
jgi:catechol 2,3-dioxygenase-like lactoylglutathione lyase family enzyme